MLISYSGENNRCTVAILVVLSFRVWTVISRLMGGDSLAIILLIRISVQWRISQTSRPNHATHTFLTEKTNSRVVSCSPVIHKSGNITILFWNVVLFNCQLVSRQITNKQVFSYFPSHCYPKDRLRLACMIVPNASSISNKEIMSAIYLFVRW